MKKNLIVVFALAALAASAGSLTDAIAKKHKVKRTDVFAGGQRTVFDFEGHDAWVVEPPEGVKVAEGKPWTWTMQWATAFVSRTPVSKLLARGWHHATIDTYKYRMDRNGLAVSRRFQDYLTGELGLARKTCLIGMSWGGFFSTRYTAANPDCVKAICYDAPLMNFSAFANGKGDGPWPALTPADGWANSPEMPVNMASAIAAARIPIMLLYGKDDKVVPCADNCELFVKRFRRAGGEGIVVRPRGMWGHHPHGVEESDPSVANFFEQAFRAPDAEKGHRLSVFQFAIKRVMKDRGVSMAEAAKLLRGIGVTGFDTNYDDKDIPAYVAAGFRPASFYGWMKFDSPDNGRAQAQTFVDTAVRYGAPRVMVLADNFPQTADAAERERITQRIVAGLRDMVAYGQKKGVVVTIEDFGNPNNICSYASGMSRLFDSVPELSYAIDSGNFLFVGRGDDVVAFGRRYRDRIAHVHLKDRSKENIRQYATIGAGDVPNADVIRLAREIGYAGWYTIENPVGDDVLADVEKQAAYIRACLK